MTIKLLRYNYTSTALEYLGNYYKKLDQQFIEYDRSEVKQVLKLLHASPKFMLPEMGELIKFSSFDFNDLDLVKLPYPCCVLEFPSTPKETEQTAGITIHDSTRRIALCFESHSNIFKSPHVQHIESVIDDKGIFVVPVSYMNEAKAWMISSYGMFIPYNNKHYHENWRASKQSVEMLEWKKSNKYATKRHEPFFSMTTFIIPSQIDMMIQEVGFETMLTSSLIDTNDEVNALLQMCIVLHTENVNESKLKASSTLQRKRKKSKKPPLYDYHILTVPGYNTPDDGDPVITNKSISMHLRRGHIRRYRNEDGSVRLARWIGATTVKKHSPAPIKEKDYYVRAIEEPEDIKE